jgi:hypothetical protein
MIDLQKMADEARAEFYKNYPSPVTVDTKMPEYRGGGDTRGGDFPAPRPYDGVSAGGGLHHFNMENASVDEDPKIKITNGKIIKLDGGSSITITNLGGAVDVEASDYVFVEWTVGGNALIKAEAAYPDLATFSGPTQLKAHILIGRVLVPTAAILAQDGVNLAGGLRAVNHLNLNLAIVDFLYTGKYAQILIPYAI